MNYKERDRVGLYYQLSTKQQHFVDELLLYLGDTFLNTKTYRLITSSLIDCLLDDRPRSIMEAIAASAHIDPHDDMWQKLISQGKIHGILSRKELQLYRSLETVSHQSNTFREYVALQKKCITSSQESALAEVWFVCTAATKWWIDCKMRKVFVYKDVVKTLEKLGCVVANRNRWAHEMWYNPLTQLFFTVIVPHGPDGKMMRHSQLLRILMNAHIIYDDFARYYSEI